MEDFIIENGNFRTIGDQLLGKQQNSLKIKKVKKEYFIFKRRNWFK